jgi:16S rRNA (uracil1498-N3)-methyltransferase
MTRRRWIADEVKNDRAALVGAHAAHLSRTLRARVGQEFEVACGDRVCRAIIASVDDERVEFELGEEVTVSAPLPITLLLAVFKFDRMEWAIEKCTELNVTSIIPVIARRTEKHLAQAAEKRVERWRRIGLEASEQARRVAPPGIGDPVKLVDALEASAELRILAETEGEAHLLDVLRARDDIRSLALAIGPEGGWTSDEFELFEQARWTSASLGTTILRAETAAIAALALARSVTD